MFFVNSIIYIRTILLRIILRLSHCITLCLIIDYKFTVLYVEIVCFVARLKAFRKFKAWPGKIVSRPERSSGSPSNACIRDTCTTDRSDHHPRRHAAGSTEDPDHAYHLLLDEVEAHGDQAHPGEYVERAGAQAEFLQGGGRGISSNGHQVAETDRSEAGEAEVATFQETPTLQTIEHHCATAYVDQHDY